MKFFDSIDRAAKSVTIIVLSFVLICGGAGIWAVRQQTGALAQQKDSADLLRNHLEADMMHDAIRSDVFRIIIAADRRAAADLSSAREDLADHIMTIQDRIARDMAFTGSATVSKVTAALAAPMDSYVAAAKSIGSQAVSNPALAESQIGSFQSQFELLEASMASASDVIQQHQVESVAAANALSFWAVVIVATGLVLAIGASAAAGLLLQVHLVKPLLALSTTTSALAEGEDRLVPYRHRHDELGAMAQAVDHFRQAALDRSKADAVLSDQQRMIAETLANVLRTIASGDLTQEVAIDFPASYAAVTSDLNALVLNLRGMIQSIVESATDIQAGSNEIAAAAEDLARRTETNASSLEQTAATLVQIDTRLKSGTQASLGTAHRADRALATVGTGRSTAEGAVQAMGRVSETAKGIDSVIEGLDKIAFQTRVLAMNAAVEAGRAGDAGRGFAVVADLVSALAMRAEEEARRAREQLTMTQVEIATAVNAVKQVDDALATISTDVTEVHTLLDTLARDNLAQSTAVSEVTGAIGSMDVATQQNAAMVEETSACARKLSLEVDSLVEQASVFRFERRKRQVPVAVERRASKKTAQGTRAGKPVAVAAMPRAPAPTPRIPDAMPVPALSPASAGADQWAQF